MHQAARDRPASDLLALTFRPPRPPCKAISKEALTLTAVPLWLWESFRFHRLKLGLSYTPTYMQLKTR
jgi:hypothetical protein